MLEYSKLSQLANNPIVHRYFQMYANGTYNHLDNPYEAMLERLVEALVQDSDTLREDFMRHLSAIRFGNNFGEH